MAITKDDLLAIADDRGEIAYTSNTRDILDEAVEAGLALPVSGKFREVETGHLNSIYHVLP